MDPKNKEHMLTSHYSRISIYDSDISNDSDDYDISNIFKYTKPSSSSSNDDSSSSSDSSSSNDDDSSSNDDSSSSSDNLLGQSGSGDSNLVNVSNFNEIVLESKIPVFVDFYVDWCGHCQHLVPIWQELNESTDKNKVKIVKYEATGELPQGITIDGFPTIILFKNGDKIPYTGERSLEEFNKFLDKNINQYGGDRKRSTKYIVDGKEIIVKGKSIPKKKEEITGALLYNYNLEHQCKDKYCKYYRKVIKTETKAEHDQRHIDRINKYGEDTFQPNKYSEPRKVKMLKDKYIFKSFPGCKGECQQEGGCGPMCLFPLLMLGAGKVKSKISAKLRLIKIVKSTNPSKKLMAVFEKNGRIKTTHFGSAGMSDYTIHKDPARKKRYLNRHRKNENWNDPTSAGSLSKNILWGKTSLRASIVDYKRRFHFN